MLGQGSAGLGEFEKQFVVVVPLFPGGKARGIGVAGFGEVGPVGLDDGGEFFVAFGKGQPAPASIGKGVEHEWDFEAVKGAEFRFAFAGDGAIELIDKGARAGAVDECGFGTDGTGHEYVIAGAVEGDIAVHYDLRQVEGDGHVCPATIKGMGDVGKFTDGGGGWVGFELFLGGGSGGFDAEGAEFSAVEAGEKIDLLYFA